MSVVSNSKYGWFISHEKFIKEIYLDVDGPSTSFHLKPQLFKILSPYKLPKRSAAKGAKTNLEEPFELEVRRVEELYKLFYAENSQFFSDKATDFEVRNEEAVRAAADAYNESGRTLLGECQGANPDRATIKTVQNGLYLFPENCIFYNKDVKEMSQCLDGEKFDLVLLDPPWWNKYIRRKRKHGEEGYDMLYDGQLKEIPLEKHLEENALVVVWCTNSPQHLEALLQEIFPKWGLKVLGKWYWVKVTQSGSPVCPFAKPPRKQPFEQIIVASRHEVEFPRDRLVVSVPSALHSHKPPLLRLLEPFLPENPKCLEVFARYLLPNVTSYGKEVLRLQHESLYTKVSK